MPPRYHYVPSLFLAALLALAAETAATRGQRARHVTQGTLLALLAWLSPRVWWDHPMVAGLVTSDVLRHETRRLEAEVERTAERVLTYLPNTPVGVGYLTLHGEAALCLLSHPDGVARGKTVRFVESDPRLLDFVETQQNTPISQLIISSDASRTEGHPQ